MNSSRNKISFYDENNRKTPKNTKEIFAEIYAVAPAPSRDYYALQLYQKKFLWTRWKICHGPYAAPVQSIVPLEDFKNDATMQNELTYIFGRDATNLISDLANERWSLTTMPSVVLQKILSFLSVSDILRLSLVCKRLSKECASNELWKSICKKQWKILIHNDTEKASLIGWKTVYLEKMRPRRYKHEAGHHQVKSNFSQRTCIRSVSTLNTPESSTSATKSNFTIHKRVQEIKKCHPIRSSSEIYGKDFKASSTNTGKSTEKTFTFNKGKCYKNVEQKPISNEKVPLKPGKYLHPFSYSTINLMTPSEKKKQNESFQTNKSPGMIRSKVTSIRVRSGTSTTIQPTTNTSNKLCIEKIRPNTGKPSNKHKLK